MGAKKSKSKGSKASKVGKAASALGSRLLGGGSKKGGGKRRSRQTPEKLAKQILVLKLKRKLWKLKYGGR